MSSLILAVSGLIVYWAFSSAITFYANYRNAKQSGLPLVLCPLNPQSLPFIFLNVPLRPLLERILPPSIYDRIKVGMFNWEFRDKHDFHDRIGPAFVLVTTGVNELWCGDPAMAQVILAQRKDFQQARIIKRLISIQGENILTADGEVWAQQRRLIAPNLNERISEMVWKESRRQALGMVEYMLSQPDGVSNEAIDALRAVTINVLSQIGYGVPKSFAPHKLPRKPTDPMGYIDAVCLSTELIVMSTLMSPKILALPFMPVKLRTLAVALKKLPDLTRDMLEQERIRAANSEGMRDNIMSMLVRIADSKEDGGGRAAKLSDEEISGNMFLITAAGFDTVANTFSYAVTLMAIYPDIQSWVQDELDTVLPGCNVEDAEYTTVFPKLIRCLSIMLETLRLFPVLVHVTRESNAPAHTIHVHGNAHNLVGPYQLRINNACLHTTPKIWGSDTDVFRPSRWIDNNVDGPRIMTPVRGSFLPWCGGPRVCPGQKMSQVEFVMLFATLFSKCNIRPARRDSETLDQACKRLFDVTQNSRQRLTLQMIRPGDVELQWTRR